jgi:purine-nucleoside phosphorylase
MISENSYSLKTLLEKNKISAPKVHFVLGSGLAPAFDSIPEVPAPYKFLREISFNEVAGLVPSTAPGHRARFRFYLNQENQSTIVFQVGRLHGYEGHSPKLVVQPLVQSALAGCTHFVLNNAAGSLNPKFLPGSLMLIRDHVNMTGQNPFTGPNPIDPRTGIAPGPRFLDMSETYSEEFSNRLKKSLVSEFTVHEGTYLGLSGPTYETPAEVKLFASWGLGAVGMSTVWEAMAIRHLGGTVSGFSLISNMGCGLVSKGALSHTEVEEEAAKVAPKLLVKLFNFAQTLR